MARLTPTVSLWTCSKCSDSCPPRQNTLHLHVQLMAARREGDGDRLTVRVLGEDDGDADAC
jgi:hypothetical protein